MAASADSTTASRRAFIGGVAAIAIPITAQASERTIDKLWREHLDVCAGLLEASRRGRALGRDDDGFFKESDDAFWASVKAVDSAPPSPETAAARVLIACNVDSCTYDTVSSLPVVEAALEGLRPLVSGPVAETVSDYLDHPDRPFAYGPLWGCEVEPGKTAVEMMIAVETKRRAA